MVKVTLFLNGDLLVDCELPAVPRIGETIIYAKPQSAHRAAVVKEVVWDAAALGAPVRLHVTPLGADSLPTEAPAVDCGSNVGPCFVPPSH